MKKKSLIVLTVVFLITVFNSCRHEPVGIPATPPPVPGGGTVPDEGNICSADTVYFQNKVLPLLISGCAKSNCHDAASKEDGIELTSYEKIMSTADIKAGKPGDSKLYKVLNETDPDKIMPRPPSNPLSQSEKEIISKWILQGARNNACKDCDTSTITWSGAMLPIININCKGCHNPSFLSGGLNLTLYANVKAIATNGKLMGSVDHLPGFPAMPNGAAKLNDCKITQIKKWIAAGSLNN